MTVTIAEFQSVNKREREAAAKPKLLLLSSSLLTDRMLLYSGFLERLATLSRVKIWATSYSNSVYREMWNGKRAIETGEFPPVRQFPLPYNYLRRLNEFAWDARQKNPSRVSMEKHRRQNRGLIEKGALRPLARLLAYLKYEQFFENRLESLLTNYNRSETALDGLRTEKPDAILVTAPFQFHQPAIAAAAKHLGIPVLCLIPSWDNISTKNRMVFRYDGYVVWSEQAAEQLREFYPQTRGVPVYATGAAQFDVFFQNRFHQTREEFCREQKLDPKLPIILYALGSPNFLREYHGALTVAERVANGALGRVQMLVRPHPMFDKGELSSLFDRFAPRVRLQKIASTDKNSSARSQNAAQITEWVNTFRHADVLINLSSTATIDAAIFDCPVINLDFDPQPNQADQSLIKEINHAWTHFKPVAESGGVWLVDNYAELERAVKTYLENPALHREKRRWIAEYVCGKIDGAGGERMANAVLDFANRFAGNASKFEIDSFEK